MTRDETLTAEEVEGKNKKRMAELEKEFKKYLKDSSDYYDPREPLTERKLLQMWLDCAEPREKRIAELEAQIEKMKWHKLNWDKAEENPDVDKLVRVKTRSGVEYICETYSYFPTEDEIGYGSVITQFAELNGDWVDDNEIEYWCYIEPFKEIKEK